MVTDKVTWSVPSPCQSQHNLTLPDWVTPDVLEKLEVLRDLSLEVKLEASLANSPPLRGPQWCFTAQTVDSCPNPAGSVWALQTAGKEQASRRYEPRTSHSHLTCLPTKMSDYSLDYLATQFWNGGGVQACVLFSDAFQPSKWPYCHAPAQTLITPLLFLSC